MKELKTSLLELIVLFNEHLLDDWPSIEVRSDIMDMKLFSLDLRKQELKEIIGKRDLEGRLNELSNGLPEKLVRELPDHRDLLDAFRSSFITPPTNIMELQKRLEEVTIANCKSKGFRNQTHIAIDSNIACRLSFAPISERFGPTSFPVSFTM